MEARIKCLGVRSPLWRLSTSVSCRASGHPSFAEDHQMARYRARPIVGTA